MPSDAAVLVQSEVVEEDCIKIVEESRIDVTGKQCLQVFITITAPPFTGVNTEVAASDNEVSISSGNFEKPLSNPGLDATVVSPPSEQPGDVPSSPPSTSVITVLVLMELLVMCLV